jgi:hypothetical protein
MCAKGAPFAPTGGEPIAVVVSLPLGGEAKWFTHPSLGTRVRSSGKPHGRV